MMGTKGPKGDCCLLTIVRAAKRMMHGTKLNTLESGKVAVTVTGGYG